MDRSMVVMAKSLSIRVSGRMDGGMEKELRTGTDGLCIPANENMGYARGWFICFW